MKFYDHKKIEKKWQKEWEKKKLHETPDAVRSKENFYALVEFPYPSGDLHVGHWYAFTVPDIFVRMKRMQGFNALYPIGFDAFGLPAENAAIQNKVNPSEWTWNNIERMRKQLRSMGNTFDWSREVVTCDPSYYKWTQWLFLKLFEKGLAYRGKALVNWDPVDQTVLANEQVLPDGTAERSGAKVEKKELEQWFFKITDYAERLLNDLDELNWPGPIKEAQRNWIGKSEGAEIEFKLEASSLKLQASVKVFTTRPDTIFGATYLVLSPEHELLQNDELGIKNKEEIQDYVEKAKGRSELQRQEAKEKTGLELKGIKAINPANDEEIPVWVADYVLPHYGTGAIMAVPAHDERDWEFAGKYGLLIKQVIEPVYVNETTDGGIKKDKPILERHSIMAIVKHWSEDKYIGLKWKTVNWQTLITGAPEEGQSFLEGAINEIKEETGYINLKFVKNLSKVHSKFFHIPKQINRFAHFQTFYFELVDDKRQETSEQEKDRHEVMWISQGDMKNFLTPRAHKYVWSTFVNGLKVYNGEGILANSEKFSGMDSERTKKEIVKFVGGKWKIVYKLRDWLISRQRYWGASIPIVYDTENKPHPIPEKYLPWLLPKDVDFKPTGVAPLARSKELAQRTERIFGKGWRPEVDTMDTFVDSSWYFLRYLDSQNEKEFSSVKEQKPWMPVERYSGGAEHTTLHLLYSRFFYKALYDLKLTTEKEPYKIRMNRGIILGEDGRKMSKRWKNVINPDKQVEDVGADAVRMYLAFIGPFNEVGSYPWSMNGLIGVRKFLERVWRIQDKLTVHDQQTTNDKNLDSLLHKTIKKVTEEIESMKFNTAVSSLMILSNEFQKADEVPKDSYEIFLKLLSPFAPHLAEEIWHSLDHKRSIHEEHWPVHDKKKIVSGQTKLVIQVNGKVRAVIDIDSGLSQDEVEKMVMAKEEVKKYIEGKKVAKTLYIQDKIFNIVLA